MVVEVVEKILSKVQNPEVAKKKQQMFRVGQKVIDHTRMKTEINLQRDCVMNVLVKETMTRDLDPISIG